VNHDVFYGVDETVFLYPIDAEEGEEDAFNPEPAAAADDNIDWKRVLLRSNVCIQIWVILLRKPWFAC
jgi:hypothetical protein